MAAQAVPQMHHKNVEHRSSQKSSVIWSVFDRSSDNNNIVYRTAEMETSFGVTLIIGSEGLYFCETWKIYNIVPLEP